ncbi:MAG: PAS domain S-box protein [Candidatus Thiodiazotropha sp.]
MKTLLPLERHLYFRFGALAFIEAATFALFIWLLTPHIPTSAIFISMALALAPTLGLTWIMTTRLSNTIKDCSKRVEMIATGSEVVQWPEAFTREFDQLNDNLRSVADKFRNRENDLRESEQRLKELVSNVPGVVYQFMAPTPESVESGSSVITVIRDKCMEILGIDPEPPNFFDEFVACLPHEDQSPFIMSIQEAVANQSVWHYEGRFTTPKGENIWIEAHSVPRQVGDQTVFYGLVTDITERKTMETSLRFSQFIFDKADIAIFVLGDEGEFLQTNEQVSRYLGYSQQELRKMDIFDVDTVLTRDVWPEFMTNLRNHGVQTIETFNRRKDGKVIPIQVLDNIMRFEGEEFHVAFVQDISEHKQMEQALREKQQRLDLALSGANEGIWDWYLEQDQVYFDARYYTMAGYLPGEFPCALEEWEKRTHQDDAERVKATVERYLTGELENFEVEFRFRRKDGSFMWIQGKGKVVNRDEAGKPLRFIGTHTDISHRKIIEESLRLTQFIFDKAPIGIWKMGRSGEILDVNEEGCSSLGYTRNELRKMSVFDFAPGFEKEDWSYGISVLNKEKTRTLEAQHQRKNGEIFPIQVIENVMRFEGQDFHVAFVQDITSRKQNEKELYRLRNYLTNIIDSMPSALIGVDSDGRVTQWNKTVEQSTGINADNARGNNVTDLLPWMSAMAEKIRHSIRTREIIHEQANTRPCENHACYEDVTIYPLVTNGVEGAVIRIDDVSEKVKLQEMMIQSEKMLSVGGLAAGMAHEINNPLAGILQTANVLSNRLTDKLENPASINAAEAAGTTTNAIQTFMQERGIPRMLDAIRDSGSRIAEIVDNMLSFARKSNATISSHSINELMDKSIKLAMADYDLKKEYDFKQIQIIRDYADQLPEIPCEGAKIQQVLLNLLSNGAQAMAENETSTSRFILRTYLDQKSKQVCLEVEDNGPGMDETTRRRVFEPFFTTKAVGVGTGLGLSISYFIICENHDGRMSVESSPGNGSRFKICLPIHRVTSE